MDRHQLVIDHWQYVEVTAHSMTRHHPPGVVDYDDTYSAAALGLYNAAMRYNPTGGATFRTYAYEVMRTHVIDAWRRWNHTSRNPTTQKVRLLVNLTEPKEELVIEDPTDDTIEHVDLTNAINQLPARMRTVIDAYYQQDRTHANIAAELGITESGVWRIRQEAIRKIRETI